MVFAGMLTACADKKVAKDKVDKNDTAAIASNNDCPPDIMCTMDFRSVSLTLTDQNNGPVILDSFRSDLATKDSVLMDQTSEPQHIDFKNVYVVANDSHMRTVVKSGSDVVFRGFKAGREVVNHKMKIGHDCCHISLISGSNTVTIRL